MMPVPQDATYVASYLPEIPIRKRTPELRSTTQRDMDNEAVSKQLSRKKSLTSGFDTTSPLDYIGDKLPTTAIVPLMSKVTQSKYIKDLSMKMAKDYEKYLNDNGMTTKIFNRMTNDYEDMIPIVAKDFEKRLLNLPEEIQDAQLITHMRHPNRVKFTSEGGTAFEQPAWNNVDLRYGKGVKDGTISFDVNQIPKSNFGRALVHEGEHFTDADLARYAIPLKNGGNTPLPVSIENDIGGTVSKSPLKNINFLYNEAPELRTVIADNTILDEKLPTKVREESRIKANKERVGTHPVEYAQNYRMDVLDEIDPKYGGWYDNAMKDMEGMAESVEAMSNPHADATMSIRDPDLVNKLVEAHKDDWRRAYAADFVPMEYRSR